MYKQSWEKETEARPLSPTYIIQPLHFKVRLFLMAFLLSLELLYSWLHSGIASIAELEDTTRWGYLHINQYALFMAHLG